MLLSNNFQDKYLWKLNRDKKFVLLCCISIDPAPGSETELKGDTEIEGQNTSLTGR